MLVIPCYNESKRLKPELFVEAINAFQNLNIIFVDDGSTDDTAKILAEFVKINAERFSYISLSKNSGKAEAVRQGLLIATESEAEFVGYWDADHAIPINQLSLFLREEKLYPDTKAFFGSKIKMLGRDIDRSVGRQYIGRIIAASISQVSGLPIYDSQCGSKLFRNCNIIKQSIKEPFNTKWLFDVELMLRLLKLFNKPANDIFREIPLNTLTYIPGSKVKIFDIFSVMNDLLFIWKNF